MTAKLVVLLLTVWMMAQVQSQSQQHTASDIAIAEKRAELVRFMFYDYTELVYSVMQLAMPKLTKVLEELAAVKPDDKQGDINYIKTFLEKLNDFAKNGQNFDYAEVFKQMHDYFLPQYLVIAQEYNTPMDAGAISKENQLIRQALEKQNVPQYLLNDTFYKRFKYRTKKFDDAMLDYFDSLTMAQKYKEQKFYDFYNDFNGEVYPVKKYNTFKTFVERERENFFSPKLLFI